MVGFANGVKNVSNTSAYRGLWRGWWYGECEYVTHVINACFIWRIEHWKICIHSIQAETIRFCLNHIWHCWIHCIVRRGRWLSVWQWCWIGCYFFWNCVRERGQQSKFEIMVMFWELTNATWSCWQDGAVTGGQGSRFERGQCRCTLWTLNSWGRMFWL